MAKDQWLREVRGQRQQRQTKGGPTTADPRRPTTEHSTVLTQHLKAFTSYVQFKRSLKKTSTPPPQLNYHYFIPSAFITPL